MIFALHILPYIHVDPIARHLSIFDLVQSDCQFQFAQTKIQYVLDRLCMLYFQTPINLVGYIFKWVSKQSVITIDTPG